MSDISTEQLRDLIDADPIAQELAEVGDDVRLAQRLTEIAPPVYKECRLSRLGLLSLYSNPMDGMTVLGIIDAVKQQNPLVAEIARYMEPGVDAGMLPDFGLPAIRAALIAPIEAGGLGLSVELAEPILRAGERQPLITPEMAGAAR
ncbi:MAG: hypothetical protein QXT45_04795 [Candidatus Bilamarchaeaceae archaeon]